MARNAADDVQRTLDFVREVQQNGDIEKFDDFIHPEFVDHTAPAGTPADRDSGRAMMAALHTALDDVSVEVIHCFDNGAGLVATQKIVRGRQVANWMGVEATGQSIGVRIMDFLRYEEGRVIEHWSTHGAVDS